MDDDDLNDSWADLGRHGEKQRLPSMPSLGVRIAGITFRTIALHSSEHWVNLVPCGRGWEIVGFIDHRRTGQSPAQLHWTRAGRWERRRDDAMRTSPNHNFVWLPYELEEAVQAAVAGKTEDM
jgi:hypothetical protein